MSTPILEVRNLKKYFKTPRGILHAVDDVSLQIEKGKTLGIVGESGCGKSTIGRVILRLLDPTSGQILFNGTNIARLRKSQMHKMRKEMQLELKGMHEKLGITFIYVTHDQEEALTMSDKIVVMSEGKIQQIGTPEDIYNEPKNAFVADFIGDSNIFSGIMTGKYKVRFCGAEFECVDDIEHGTMIDAVVRPEDVTITTPEKGIIRGKVTSVIFKGVHYEITVQSGKNEIVVQSTRKAELNALVGLYIEPEGIHIMLAENTINRIESGVDKDYKLSFLGGVLDCDIASLIPGAAFNTDGTLVDAHGDVIEPDRIKVIVSVKPDDITMSDDKEAGILRGHIINLIYKGDHYSYVVRTEEDEDFIVSDEDLWNMDDYVSLLIPKEKFHYALKK